MSKTVGKLSAQPLGDSDVGHQDNGFLSDLPLTGRIKRWLSGSFATLALDEGQIDSFFVNMALSSPILSSPAPWVEELTLWHELIVPVWIRFKRWQMRSPIGEARREAFYYKMAELLAAGVSHNVALAKVWFDETRGGADTTSPVAVCARVVLPAIKDGKKLHHVMRDWVPEVDYRTLQAGEMAGQLPQAFSAVRELTVDLGALRSMLIKPLMTIALYGGLALGLIEVVSQILVPMMLKSVGKHVIFHGQGGKLIAVGDFLRQDGWMIVAGLSGCAAVIACSLPRLTHPVRRILDHLTVYQHYRFWTGLSWLLSMATMASQGIPPKQALMMQLEGANAYLQSRLRRMLVHVRNGKSLAMSMALSGDDFPDVQIITDFLTLSRTGGDKKRSDGTGLERDALQILAKNWLRHTQRLTDQWSAWASRIGMALAVLAIAWIIGGVFDIQNQMKILTRHHL